MALISEFDKRIVDSQNLEELLGPDLNFSDAEVTSINLDRHEPSITITIRARSHKNYKAIYLLTLIFHDIDDLLLENFNHQNIIMNLIFQPKENRIMANISSKFGAELSFTYQTGQVISIAETC